MSIRSPAKADEGGLPERSVLTNVNYHLVFQPNVKKQAATWQEVFDRAIKILALRDHSEQELRSKLAQRFEDGGFIEKAVQECVKLKYVDDDRFAQAYVQQLQKKGKSSFAIRQALKKKGVADSILRQHLEENRLNDLTTATALIEKKKNALAKLPPEKQKAKIASLLHSRGFSSDIVFKIFRSLNLEE